MRVLFVLLALVLAGCASPEAATAVPPAGKDAANVVTTPTQGESTCMCGVIAERPMHAVGDAWTFKGQELYNPDEEFTVVVAQVRGDGYRFAGGSEDDVHYAALWGSIWFGDVDLDHGQNTRPLAFPIEDGKKWNFWEGLEVTATLAEITTFRGKELGFIIEGESQFWKVRYEYAPSLGNIVLWEAGFPEGGSRAETVRMTGATTNASWVWYELGPAAHVGSLEDPQTFDVGAGYDAVIASVGGLKSSRAVIRPPSGEPWTMESPEAETWQHVMFEPLEGKWAVEVIGRPFIQGVPESPAGWPVGWAYVGIAPVKWLRG